MFFPVNDSITYKKAPLVELIVEVRWAVETMPIPGGGPAFIAGRSATFDSLFQNLSNDLREAGYHELERLVPHDMPPMARKPVFRFKRQGQKFPVVQLGHGVLTVNAGPPDYISWNVFRPEVEKALSSLATHKSKEDPSNLFHNISLRYIDVFNDELRNGMSNFNFMKDVLGVPVSLPGNLLGYASGLEDISPTIALKIPLKDAENTSLTFQLAAGRMGQAVNTDTIMDMTYAVNHEPTGDSEVLLNYLDNAHRTIHSWFEILTSKLHDRMSPVNAA